MNGNRPAGGASYGDALTRNMRALRGRLFLGALAGLLVVTLLALGLVWRQYENAKQEAVDTLRTRAVLAATVFDTYFAGQLAELSAIAASPTVVSRDTRGMTEYFARFRPGRRGTFSAGVGWIDLSGRQRATSDPAGPIPVPLSDRTYFSRVVSDKKPFVSEAIVARTTGRRLVVMSVPTRDERGRLTGVLAGGIVLPQSSNDARANDLGYSGLEVIDRAGQQVTLRTLAQPENRALLAQLRKEKEGVLVDTRGLGGSDGRVIAYALSETPEWLAVLDEPASGVFAGARRSLFLEAMLVGIAAVLLAGLIVWALRRTRRDLRLSRAQVSRWAGLTRALNDASNADEIRGVLANALASEFPEAVVIVIVAEPGVEPDGALVVRGPRSRLRKVDEELALRVATAAAGADAPVALESLSELEQHVELGELSERLRSLYGIPLLDETGMPIGAAALLFASESALASHQLSLAQAHVDQVRQALARVRRHEQEHDVAVLLQQSLLPSELPQSEGVELAAYYRAGVANTQVGGDWYDVVRRPDGILHLTVGDVAGRGMQAAVTMAHLRHAFRAYALDHASPAAIIHRVHRHVDRGDMATMVCLTYDPFTGELVYASAGHLPPLVIDPEAAAPTHLDGSRVGPLGWIARTAPKDTHVLVAPNTTIALYTDGLVERRDSDLQAGIDRLGQALQTSASEEPAVALDLVVGQLTGASADDVALLLARVLDVPRTLRIELDAEPSLLRDFRRRLRTWLDRRGVEERDREATVLAVSEACNNVIDHAYEVGTGVIRVQIDHGSSALSIRVEDDGSWRDQQPSSDRGRGIAIMRGLMDKTEIVRSAQGTQVALEQRL